MIEVAQSQLMTLIAGAVLASALLGFASYESAAAADAEALAVLDALAGAVATVRCGALSPSADLDLRGPLAALPDAVVSLTLLPDRLRASFADGHARASIEFPALPIAAPQDLTGASSLRFAWDPLLEACAVDVLPIG